MKGGRAGFDQNVMPYTRLTDADIWKGDLNQRFDAILIPDNLVGGDALPAPR
jgi:hypothetical protein